MPAREEQPKPVRVAIQGTRGAFSEAAARLQWRDLAPVSCRTVTEVVAAVRSGAADAGCLPIENSLVGAVTPTYDLLHEAFGNGELHLSREILLPVHHALLGLPDAPLSGVRRVLSHPVALGQCQVWLTRHLPHAELVSVWDTAGAAEQVAQEGDPHQAAICAGEASEVYGLQVFDDRIEDDPTNQTRFLSFTREPQDEPADGERKTSLIVWTDNRPGMLAAVLQAFAARGINLTSLVSRPERSVPWASRFYLDVEGSAEEPRIIEALEGIEALANRIVVLGSYLRWPGEERANPRRTPLVRQRADLPLFDRRQAPDGTIVRVGTVEFGGARPVLIAGPCSVENREMILQTAAAVAAAGGDMLRGGAFKPRTSPYDFQGLGARGLKLLAEARERTGLPVVTEVLSWEEVPLVARYADMLQIGARNMQNFALLRAAGRSGKPILLKRNGGATIEEWLHAAEYVLANGNPHVVLCERGIRTFERATRHTLDLNAVALVRERTHLPVLADPSHAAGVRNIVPALTHAALAAGAHGVIVEVHPDPDRAVSDGPQSLTLEEFAVLASAVRERETVSGGR